jgi:hypothetical protein
MLMVVSCGGRVGGGGGDGGSSPNGPDAGAAGSGLTCTDPIHVSIGGTINGSTCGGTYRPENTAPCVYDSPVAYLYVDAPAGAAFSINSPMPLFVSFFTGCDDNGSINCGGTPFTPTVANLHLFTVQFGSPQTNPNADGGICGDFTITVVGH